MSNSNISKTFSQAKDEFNKKYNKLKILKQNLVPVNGKPLKDIALFDTSGQPLEEFYKWQFVYSCIESGLYPSELIGVEVYFPKGSKSSNPLKVDACIFDDKDWIKHYNIYSKDRTQLSSLEFLKKHCIASVEFKRGKDSMEQTFSTQLKPAMNESDRDYVLGVIYDSERLYLFHRQDGKIIRYDDNKNSGKGAVGELSLNVADSYLFIPDLDDILKRNNLPGTIDRTNRSISDLDLISGRLSSKIKDSLNDILRTLEKYSMLDTRGYGILIQTLAAKIFDEKRNQEKQSKKLKYYILDEEKKFSNLNESEVQDFVKRMKGLFEDSENQYKAIFKDKHVSWDEQSHIQIIQTIVKNFQDYSFVNSEKTDLYQLVFHNFADQFTKITNGQFLTPLEIIEFLVKIVNPRGDDLVCDPCLGSADFLSLSYRLSEPKLSDTNLYGIDIDDKMVALGQLNMILNGDGNSHLIRVGGEGSILNKITKKGDVVPLVHNLHAYDETSKIADWDNWKDGTELKKFDVVLTNPPFGKGRTFEAKTEEDRKILDMYETFHIKNKPPSLDKGIIFLENAYHILDNHGRLGIVISNAIASEDSTEEIREWLLKKMRIVAIFDLPPNVFAETGVNTTLIIAYKDSEENIKKLKDKDYSVFTRNITKVGYIKKTKKRNVVFETDYKIDPTSYDIMIDSDGNPIRNEDFSSIISEFKDWAKTQEDILQKIFLN
jgi:type I restriction enzyme M protein